jgi:hypothetical protein
MFPDLKEAQRREKSEKPEDGLQRAKEDNRREDHRGDCLPAAQFMAIRAQRPGNVATAAQAAEFSVFSAPVLGKEKKNRPSVRQSIRTEN